MVIERLAENLPLVVLLLGAVSVLVGALIVSMAFRASRRMKTARDLIINYLKSRNLRLMSFEGIRDRIDASYSDAFLQQLPGYFPNDLRRARLRGGIPGLARLSPDSDDERNLLSLGSLERLRDTLDEIINSERARAELQGKGQGTRSKPGSSAIS